MGGGGLIKWRIKFKGWAAYELSAQSSKGNVFIDTRQLKISVHLFNRLGGFQVVVKLHQD